MTRAIISILVCFCLPASPQVSEQLVSTAFDDVQTGYEIPFEAIFENDGNKIRDMSQTNGFGQDHAKQWHTQSQSPNSFSCRESNTLQHLRQDDGKIFTVGYESILEKVSYDQPIAYWVNPMAHGEKQCGYFHGTGTYCDKLQLQAVGTYELSVDPVGTVILPGGNDTLENVSQVHVCRHLSMLYYPANVKIPNLSVPDSICATVNSDSTLIVCDEYRWYAPGYRYSVFEARSSYSLQSPSLRNAVAYYYPPDSQEQFAYGTDVNRMRQCAQAKAHEDSVTPKGGKYTLRNNRESHCVAVSFDGTPPAGTSILLTDISGIVTRSVQCESIKGNSVKIQYDGLRQGNYLIHVNMGKSHFVEKFNIKKD